MIDFSIPESWLSTSLGDVVNYGKTIKVERSEVADDTWVLELEDIEKDTSKILKRLTFADRKFKSTKNRFHAGDVLYGKLRPYLNKVVIADADGVCSTEIIPMESSVYLDNRYLFYWVKHPGFLAYVTEVGYGVNMPRLGTKDGKAAPFVLAPLAEQQQIAAKLDELLAQVDTLKTRLDAIPAILKRFRQSVLAAAVSGRLTDGSREYDCAPFGKLIHEMKNGLSSKPNEDGRGYPILRISSVRPFAVNEEDVRYLECDVNTRSVYALKRDDLLFTRYNGSLDFVGVCGRNKQNNYDTLLYPDKLIRVRTKRDVLLPGYAELFFSAPQIRKVVTSFVKSTSGQKGISGKDLKSVLVDFPVVEEQTEIVRRVEQLFAFADQIEQRVRDAQARVNQLTQSILAKAFRGELTAEWRAQHPELITGEHSAQALLERIKAEQKTIKPVKKKRVARKSKAALS